MIREHSDYPGYYVSDAGDIYSENHSRNQHTKTKVSQLKKLKPQRKGQGYLGVFLRVDGQTVQRYIHRLVAEVYIDNPDDLPQVNHKDRNKHNNAVENLEWCDAFYNMEHAMAKHYMLEDLKTGEKFKVFNMRKFAREHNYDQSFLIAAAKRRGYCKTAYGYEVTELDV